MSTDSDASDSPTGIAAQGTGLTVLERGGKTGAPGPVLPEAASPPTGDAPAAHIRWAGTASLLGAIALESVASVQALFVVAVLHATLPLLGLIEGAAAATPGLMRVVLSEARQVRRAGRLTAVLGRLLEGLSRPLVGLSGSALPALPLVVLSEAGRALARQSGAVTGSLAGLPAAVGAATGPLLAVGALWLAGGDLRSVFLLSIVPGTLALLSTVLALKGYVPGGAGVAATDGGRPRVPVADLLRPLGARFWLFLGAATVFALGNLSAGFAVLRTAELEVTLWLVPLAYAACSVTRSAVCMLLGDLGRRWGRLPAVLTGYALLVVMSAGWGVATMAWNAWLLFALYGLHSVVIGENGRAFVADVVHPGALAVALKLYDGVTSMALLVGNVVAGWLWSQHGSGGAYGYGAWCVAAALGLLIAWLPWLRRGYPT